MNVAYITEVRAGKDESRQWQRHRSQRRWTLGNDANELPYAWVKEDSNGNKALQVSVRFQKMSLAQAGNTMTRVTTILAIV